MSALKKRLHERRRFERLDVAGRLTKPDELHRYPQLVTDADHDAAFRTAVELGEKNAGHVHRVPKDPGLIDGVLPDGGVEYEQHLMRRPGDFLAIAASHAS